MLSDHMPVMAEMTIDMLPHGQRGTHSGIIPWWYFVEVSVCGLGPVLGPV